MVLLLEKIHSWYVMVHNSCYIHVFCIGCSLKTSLQNAEVYTQVHVLRNTERTRKLEFKVW